MRTHRLLAAGLLSTFLVACSNTLGPGEESRVDIGFQLAPTVSASNGELVITGTNGTLSITNISFIVNGFELEAQDDACATPGDDGCEEFEAPPSFVRLSLGDGNVVVVSQAVPPGTFTELEFEVENLDMDEDDEDTGAITSAVRAAFPNWPNKASMVVVGTFTPTGSTQALPFTVFFDAEIEIEKDLVPPLVVDQQNETVTVQLDPSVWFRRFDGTVMDLSAFDFVRTGIVLEFEAELEDGFQKIEFDD